MNAKTEALIHARIKGILLEVLKNEFPNGVDFVVLRFVLSNMGHDVTEKELNGYLVYLENSKYLKLRRDDEKNILLAIIDNLGLDLIDGLRIDNAIMFV